MNRKMSKKLIAGEELRPTDFTEINKNCEELCGRIRIY